VTPLRLLVLASYFNYAFVIGDDVLVSLPMGQKRHLLNDITQPPGAIRADLLQRAIPDLSRFLSSPGVYEDLESNQGWDRVLRSDRSIDFWPDGLSNRDRYFVNTK